MKIVLTLSGLFCLSTIAFAQIPLGFKAGANINQMEIRDLPTGIPHGSYATNTSFHVGVFTKIKIANKFNLIPELQFIEKKSSFKLSYIELPVLISYSPIPWLSIEAGGSYALNVGNGLDVDAFTEPDAGILGGLRFNYRQWSFLTRYYYGLAPVDKLYLNMGPQSTDTAIIKTYNKNTQFSVTYYLRKN